MERVLNFGPGPAMLPDEVLKQAQEELLDWHGTGMSVMEIGHRGVKFEKLIEECEANLREIMGIPNSYAILWVAGGGSTQFAMIPLNLMSEQKQADYTDTGIWSRKAINEAKRFGQVNVVTEVHKKNDRLYIPDEDSWSLNPKADYFHYTPNETIDGVEFQWVPKVKVPLIADMTSMILSRPVDVNQFAMIYAGTQKNMGQAGLTVVIIKEELIREPHGVVPTLCTYKTYLEHKSVYNTPPTFCWYMTHLMLQWIKRQGGLKAIGEINFRKANKLYQVIDKLSDFYVNSVDPSCRSIMNVPFSLRNEALTSVFLEEATHEGLTYLKGHRLAGGVRASIYNAMPEKGVDKLIQFMEEFAKRNG